jgi:hypothetical protein
MDVARGKGVILHKQIKKCSPIYGDGKGQII